MQVAEPTQIFIREAPAWIFLAVVVVQFAGRCIGNGWGTPHYKHSKFAYILNEEHPVFYTRLDVLGCLLHITLFVSAVISLHSLNTFLSEDAETAWNLTDDGMACIYALSWSLGILVAVLGFSGLLWAGDYLDIWGWKIWSKIPGVKAGEAEVIYTEVGNGNA